MRVRRGAIALLLLVASACATSTPPSVRVTDIRTLAGHYSGSLKEDGELSRSAVLIVQTDGQRVIVLTKTDGTMTTRVAKSLP